MLRSFESSVLIFVLLECLPSQWITFSFCWRNRGTPLKDQEVDSLVPFACSKLGSQNESLMIPGQGDRAGASFWELLGAEVVESRISRAA